MVADRSAPLSLFDLRRALRRHRGKAAAFFLATIAVTVIASLCLPPTYVSEAKLFVRLGRPSVRLDPTATTGQTVPVFDSRETEINSMLDVLRSRAMAERVVSVVGPELVLSGERPGRQADRRAISVAGYTLPALREHVMGFLQNTKYQVYGIEPLNDRDSAIVELQESLEISTPKRSNVVSIRCTAASPEVAQQLVDCFVEEYQEEHVRVNRTAKSYEFFHAETERLEQQLQEANLAVRAAKNEMGLGTIDGQRGMLQSRLGVIHGELDRTGAALAASQARSGALQQTFVSLPERLMTREEKGFANNARDTMRNRLYELELREKELMSKRTENHPDLDSVRLQLAEARKILDAQSDERSQISMDVNPNRQQLELALLTEQAGVAALHAEQNALQAQRELVTTRFVDLNDFELRLNELELNARLAEETYRQYVEKLVQARTDEALDRERISNVNIFQPASFEAKPVSPRLGMLAALGLFAATFGGLGVALAAEAMDRSLASADDVEQQLELPVLVSVPRVARRNVLLN